MDISTTSIRSTGSTTSKPRPGATRQVSDVSAKSQASTGSPRNVRKTAVSAVPRNGENGGSKPSTPRSKAPSTNLTPPNRSEKHQLRPTTLEDRRSSAGSVKSKVDSGNRRPERKPINGTSIVKTPSKPEARKTSTPKPKDDLVKRTNRDINLNSPREKPIRSDSSDLVAASKLVSAKVYELRTELVNNGLITAPLKDYLQTGIDTFVVLPLGRFSRNHQSLWRAAMMELLLEITVPKRRVFLDPGLIDLEKESVRSHAFLHRGDLLPADVEILDDTVRAAGTTLVYAPLSDVSAIESLIKVNEDRLRDILVIGFSLHKLAEQSDTVYLKKHLACIQEETFPFDLFPQSAFAPVFAELRGHRFTSLPKSSSRFSDMRAASCDTLTDAKSETSEGMKAAVSAPNLAPSTSKVPTTLLTIGAICCGAGLAWMFINKR